MKELENILTSVLDCQRADLYLNDTILSGDRLNLFNSILERRLRGEPLQYIIGYAEFMGLEIKVNKNVLIPRPETELLVEAALSLLRNNLDLDARDINSFNTEKVNKSYKILDMGTGSGNIAISLAKTSPHSKIFAIDISSLTLEVARKNAQANRVYERINFFSSNLFSALNKYSEFDMIISNPPYIPADEIAHLAIEVRTEPRLALDGGKDGLRFYRRIIKESPAYLKKDGILIMEMGYNQSDSIINIFNGSANFRIITLVKDYNQINRIIIAKRIE